MASSMCDVEPCKRLTKARVFFKRDVPYDPEKGILLATLQKRGSGTLTLQEMNFKYCPFCGTRLSSGLVETLLEEERYARRLGA
jgi:hypothetical protein